jgi:hypothetical protein
VKTSNTLVNRLAKFVRLGFEVEVLFYLYSDDGLLY